MWKEPRATSLQLTSVREVQAPFFFLFLAQMIVLIPSTLVRKNFSLKSLGYTDENRQMSNITEEL